MLSFRGLIVVVDSGAVLLAWRDVLLLLPCLALKSLSLLSGYWAQDEVWIGEIGWRVVRCILLELPRVILTVATTISVSHAWCWR